MANFGERYELVSRIGSGGMGEVWLAHHEQLAGRKRDHRRVRHRVVSGTGW